MFVCVCVLNFIVLCVCVPVLYFQINSTFHSSFRKPSKIISIRHTTNFETFSQILFTLAIVVVLVVDTCARMFAILQFVLSLGILTAKECVRYILFRILLHCVVCNALANKRVL